MTSSNLSNKEADCYCVCHSPFSSRASCEHCNGQYLRGLQDGEKQAKAAQHQLLTELISQKVKRRVISPKMLTIYEEEFIPVSVLEKYKTSLEEGDTNA